MRCARILRSMNVVGNGADAEAIAASFGKKSAKRSQQVAEILETLRGLGTLNTER
jgi:hypothetical protein